MVKRLCLTVLASALCAAAQSSVYLPAWTAGAGASFFNPGAQGSVDGDKQVSPGSTLYFHLAIGGLSVKSGQLYAVIRPGMEWRLWNATGGLVGAVLRADGGFATGTSVGTSTALSSFTGGGYAWLDLCQGVKSLQKFGHCYIELGGAVAGGTVISTQTSTPIQLIPSVEFRFGGN